MGHLSSKMSNGDRYRAILNEFLFTKIEEEDFGNIWFQQDGATCHIAESTLDVLRPVFLKIALSAAISHRWPKSKISVTSTSH